MDLKLLYIKLSILHLLLKRETKYLRNKQKELIFLSSAGRYEIFSL